MRIVIIGLGTTGRTVLKSIANEGHSISIIDESRKKVESLIESYDVTGVVGNGACLDTLYEAGAQNADLAIALTSSDELNIFACLVAKRIGIRNTIARVRNPEYSSQIVDMKEELGISMIVNPERDTATEIYNLISLPSIAQVEHFANGRALLVGISVIRGNPLIGSSLIDIGRRLRSRILVCAVQRGEEVIIPKGDFTVMEGDTLHFTCPAATLRDFFREISLPLSPLKNILIVGGGKISFYLARELSKRRYRIKLIVDGIEQAEELAGELPAVTVINGNGTQHDLLVEEGIEHMDAVVSLAELDEENLVISMFARKMGVKRAVSLIKNDDLYRMLGELGTRGSVSPKDIVADRITSYIRAIENSEGSKVLTLYRLVGGSVEALEFSVRSNEKILDTPLKELKIKPNCLIGCIRRRNEIIIPDGSTEIKLGDSVVVVTTHKLFDDLMDVFE